MADPRNLYGRLVRGELPRTPTDAQRVAAQRRACGISDDYGILSLEPGSAMADPDATTDECVECGEPVDDTGLPQRCTYCIEHAADLAAIPDSPVPYGQGRGE